MGTVRFLLPAVRARRRLSQRQVAAAAGIRPDTISALERGQTTGIHFETLARLCEVLDCQPGDLFSVELDSHTVPVLGGPDEDDIIRERLAQPYRRIDGPSFIAELLSLAGEQTDDPGDGR